MPAVITLPNIDDLVVRYEAGESLKQLSDELGVCRATLTSKLVKAGVNLRTKSEAQFTKWRILTPRQRTRSVEQTCSAMWQARRGQTDPESRKVQRARTRYERRLHISFREIALANALMEMGVNVTPQFPIGPYNIDIALTESLVAVEVEFAGFRSRPKRTTHVERAEYILNQGWALVFVVGHGSEWPRKLNPLPVAKQIVSLAERARRDKSIRGKYAMIRSDGKGTTGIGYNFDHLPRIPNP